MAKNAPKLTDRIREGIVTRFACCYGPDEVRAWLEDEHGIELSPPALSYYNGNNPAALAGMSEKWRAIFQERRAEYLAEVRAPIAHKAHRLELANRLVESILAKLAKSQGVNVVLVEKAQALLEYAAKEDGGMFTNRRLLEHTGKDGGPIRSSAELTGLPVADLLELRQKLLVEPEAE